MNSNQHFASHRPCLSIVLQSWRGLFSLLWLWLLWIVKIMHQVYWEVVVFDHFSCSITSLHFAKVALVVLQHCITFSFVITTLHSAKVALVIVQCCMAVFTHHGITILWKSCITYLDTPVIFQLAITKALSSCSVTSFDWQEGYQICLGKDSCC